MLKVVGIHSTHIDGLWITEYRSTNGAVIKQLNPIRQAAIWIPIRSILTQTCQQECDHES
jgi:hypothetical protein